jgi:hypothetical protein
VDNEVAVDGARHGLPDSGRLCSVSSAAAYPAPYLAAYLAGDDAPGPIDPGDPIAWWPPGREHSSPTVAWQQLWADRAETLVRTGSNEQRCAARLAMQQGFVLRPAQWQAAGITPARRRSLVRRKVWSAAARSISAVVHPGADDLSRAALAAAAAVVLRPSTVVSHESAAILHGLPVRSMPSVATVTERSRANSHGGPRPTVSLHRGPLDAGELVDWYGCPMTSVARTVVDVARRDRVSGLMAADAALHEGLTSPAALRRAALGCLGWPGSVGARWVAEYADAGGESPLESLVRWCLISAGLPRPQLQARIRDGDGWQARVDMLWPDSKVVLEADGRLKYRDDGQSLWAEKRRQERLERLGFQVVRVMWSDIEIHPAETVARVRAALARGRG